MRVTNSMIYTSVILNTSRALERYYALSEQNASMKKINSSSDDPSGYAAAMNLQDHMAELEQYRQNVAQAQGWLGAADAALQEASSLVISVMELAEQGATGTLSADERAMLAEQVREDMAAMVTLANSEYSGRSVFAGQATDSNAYEMALFADVTDPTQGQEMIASVTGDADYTVVVEFLANGDVGGANDLEYRYSSDGGETWTTASLAAGETELDLGACRVELVTGATVSEETGEGDGTTITVRPTAVYLGDADDGVCVTQYGASPVLAQASGVFSNSIIVRIDVDGDLASGQVAYSYSLDNGKTWVQGQSSEDGVFSVSGGYLLLASNGGSAVSKGEQFVITPDSAEVDLAISENSSMTISTVGLDAFGGIYQADGETAATASGDDNLFEAMGRLVGALESNDLEAIAQCIEDLGDAQAALLAVEAKVGARESRLSAAESLLELRASADTNQLSAVEDVDLTQLMVDLESASTVYQSVVETSTAIMKLSLLDYI